jgi:hypothetical protein
MDTTLNKHDSLVAGLVSGAIHSILLLLLLPLLIPMALFSIAYARLADPFWVKKERNEGIRKKSCKPTPRVRL